jgi:hypothetical protein
LILSEPLALFPIPIQSKVEKFHSGVRFSFFFDGIKDILEAWIIPQPRLWQFKVSIGGVFVS